MNNYRDFLGSPLIGLPIFFGRSITTRKSPFFFQDYRILNRQNFLKQYRMRSPMEKIKQSNYPQAAKNGSDVHLSLQVSPKLIPLLFQLLGQGFSVNIHSGVTVKDLLCKQLGIHEDYLAQRIQTIFLNAKVVDDVNTAIVAEGATLALSGAMPGLAGAILRSGGYYAAMRNQLSYVESDPSPQAQSAKITLKLMNLVAKEIGPVFLQQGIRIEGQTLREFVEHRTDDLKAGCTACELDGNPVEFTSLQEINWRDDMVMLQVNAQAVV
jgi:hypothetical protein